MLNRTHINIDHKVNAAIAMQTNAGLRLLLLALVACVVFHGGLLPFTHGQTYDAFIHMFFADHYNRSWFDPWEPRWYTGFVTISYPPGTHMMIGALMHLMPLRAAFVVVQLVGLLLLVIGIYRFSLLWVSHRSAGYAALALVLSSSISQTVHIFGQLPTIFSLALFLNALPYYFRWIAYGRIINLVFAICLSAATTSAHHVTPIFGGILFVLPLCAHALRAYADANYVKLGFKNYKYFWRPVLRASILGFLMILAVSMTVFPYWYWSITDPITQVPIPHGSRENFIERLDLGLMFFIIPWGVALFMIPYALYKSFTTLLWPLGLSLVLCFILGTGGTTSIPRLLLGGAFDILTLDRFTFWGSIIILPFVGVLLDGLMHGRSRQAIYTVFGRNGQRLLVGGLFISMAAMAGFVSILTTIMPTQPRFIEPTPIVRFMEEDNHDRWRYLTLGFGDQFAYLSSQMTAQSVDGNYHSARRLPDLTRFSVERLENAKYLGVPGLGSLEQFIVNADHYHLKYIFSNDEFYDPLLFFNGWNRLNRLQNGIVVWEKPDVTPLPQYLARRLVSTSYAVMWGILPPTALLLGFLILLVDLIYSHSKKQALPKTPVVEPAVRFPNPKKVRQFLVVLICLSFTLIMIGGWFIHERINRVLSPEETIQRYFKNLDFRKFIASYMQLDKEFRPEYKSMLLRWKWQGGLVNSYGKLDSLELKRTSVSEHLIDFNVTIHYLTGLSRIKKQRKMRLVKRNKKWFVAPFDLQLVQTPVRLQRQSSVVWNTVGRRQARANSNLHRDLLDRPNIAVHQSRIVKRGTRYSVLGIVINTDYDPAAVSIFGSLYANDEHLSRKAMGQWGGQRLLSKESAGFKVEFDGVLSLRDAKARGTFDPDEFLPPKFYHPPSIGTIEARALVNTQNLYRGIVLNSLKFKQENKKFTLTGLAVNTGTETASIVRINVLLYDQYGKPLWVECGFVDTNVYPGQSVPFSVELPLAKEISIISDIENSNVEVNGTSQKANIFYPKYNQGTIILNGSGGYSAARIHMSAMTHEPLF